MKQKIKSRMLIFAAGMVLLFAGAAVFSSVDRPVADGTKTFYDSPVQSLYVVVDGKLTPAGSIMNVKKGDQFKIFSDVTGTWTENNRVLTAASNADFDADRNRWGVKTR